jgi:hypothetical protein
MNVPTSMVTLKTSLTPIKWNVLVETVVLVTAVDPFVPGPIAGVPLTLVTVVSTQRDLSSMRSLAVVATTAWEWRIVPLIRFAQCAATAVVFATKQSVQLTNILCATTEQSMATITILYTSTVSISVQLVNVSRVHATPMLMYNSVANLVWSAIGITFDTVALEGARPDSIVLRQLNTYSHRLNTDTTPRNSTTTRSENWNGLTKVSRDIAEQTKKVFVNPMGKTIEHVVWRQTNVATRRTLCAFLLRDITNLCPDGTQLCVKEYCAALTNAVMLLVVSVKMALPICPLSVTRILLIRTFANLVTTLFS